MPLREYIAEVHEVEVDQVLVTNGSMQADAFLFQLLVNAGDSVVVESPTYDRTLLNLRNRGADIRMVELETDGIDVDELERLLREENVRPTLAHVIPNFQNPAGYTLSADKRAKLLALAGEFDFTLFEDDPYISIRFEGEGLPTMLSQDDAGQVVYASSFSKTVCPGIRVGYLVGPQAVIKQIQGDRHQHLHLAEHGRASRSSTSSAARAASRARSRPSRTRCASAATRWSPRFGATCRRREFSPPEGGYFMWVVLPEEVSVAELEKAASERGVIFVKGTDFLLEGGENTLRLAYSGVTPAQIDEGVSRLAEAVRSLGVTA